MNSHDQQQHQSDDRSRRPQRRTSRSSTRSRRTDAGARRADDVPAISTLRPDAAADTQTQEAQVSHIHIVNWVRAKMHFPIDVDPADMDWSELPPEPTQRSRADA